MAAEAPKIHGLRQAKLFDRGLQMPTQQVAPVHRTSFCIGENEILRFPVLRCLSGCIQNRPQDSVGIERNAPPSSIGLGIVEFAFVKTFDDFDSIRMNSLPTQSCNLSDPQRTTGGDATPRRVLSVNACLQQLPLRIDSAHARQCPATPITGARNPMLRRVLLGVGCDCR
jgi:hypothetical protein